MALKVDLEKCIACGVCVGVCPEALVLRDDGKAEPAPGATGEESCAQAAIDSCPTQAIYKE